MTTLSGGIETYSMRRIGNIVTADANNAGARDHMMLKTLTNQAQSSRRE